MIQNPLASSERPELESVLEALDDEDCRTIIRYLDEPRTASEVSSGCDIPMSTTYRKLDLLRDASLLSEGTQIRSDGHHATRYEVAFDSVRVERTEVNTLEIRIDRPTRTSDERLAAMWNEVRRET